MKNGLLIILLILFLVPKSFAQNNAIEIKMNFYTNDKSVNDVKYYLINNGKAYLLPKKEKKIVLNDTLTTKEIYLMAVKGKHKVVFPVYYYRESNNIEIYYDNRIFGNKAKKYLGIRKWEYLFRKEYYIIIDGFDDMIIVFKSKKEYKLIND